jgi:hypothetical protein
MYSIAQAKRAIIILTGSAICIINSGCASFCFMGTKTYHEAAVKEVYTTICVNKDISASLSSNAILTLSFSGWNECITHNAESEEMLSVSINTLTPSNSTDIVTNGSIAEIHIDQTYIKAYSPDKDENGQIIPVHILTMKDIRQSWESLAAKQTEAGVWLRKDRLQFLYIPPKSSSQKNAHILVVISQGKMKRKNPALMYGYPIAVPVIVAVDIITIPIKAIAVVYVLLTWDGQIF